LLPVALLTVAVRYVRMEGWKSAKSSKLVDQEAMEPINLTGLEEQLIS